MSGHGDQSMIEGEDDFEQIALVGVAGRYPSSPNISTFWENIRKGRDCLKTFTADELEEIGIGAEHYGQPNFVPRGSELPDARGFDARFFGFTPQEAAVMDPQSRIFLETCWEALEDSGYAPTNIDDAVGIFAGSNPNDYAALLGVADPSDSLTAFNQLIGSDKDFLATRVSHRLNLRGPALTLQTACSTSLVAVHLAVQSLLNYECTMALAGGVTVNLRQGVGYFAQPGMILSPAGTCRAFDEAAEGTTLGQGCGVAVLKRLSDAIADDDHIYAVVKATAINNDGSSKISYTAPSEDGQAEVIALAHQLADIESDSIGLLEAHGTGTKLGDPVEIAALTRAFAPGTDRTQYCAIGSAKTNFGHTDAAAGITGFLKAALALHHRELPPSIHFETPNPAIGFENTPFFVNTELSEWTRNGTPRRAGVSAFGIGGTNAHVILEEAPERASSPAPVSAPVILPISAKSSQAADDAVSRMEVSLGAPNGPSVSDVAFTLRSGRVDMKQRRAMIWTPDQLAFPVVGGVAAERTEVVALYPGQGMQYPGMAADLYANEPAFAAAVDECLARFDPLLDQALAPLILRAEASSADLLDQTRLTQPALFTIEYALSKLFASWGIVPDVVIGHSIGEFAAAVEVGIFTLDDATRAVAERGRLMQEMEPGSMAAVMMDAGELQDALPDEGVSIAALNAPQMSVVSGPDDAIDLLLTQLDFRSVRTKKLATSHAFHSSMMDVAAERFAAFLSEIELRPPNRPMVSNVTGDWLTESEATDPAFWASQIRFPVRFADCIARVANERESVAFLELGPGNAMSTFASRNDQVDGDTTVMASATTGRTSEVADHVAARRAVGSLWCAGVELDWEALGQGSGRRVSLPTYPFERVEHWAPARKHQLALPGFGEQSDQPTGERNPVEEWLWSPTWSRLPYLEPQLPSPPSAVVAFLASNPDGDALGEALQDSYRTVLSVRAGDEYVESNDQFFVRPDVDADFEQLADALIERGIESATILHAWTLGIEEDPAVPDTDDALNLGINSVLSIGRHLGSTAAAARLLVATHGSAPVFGTERSVASHSALVGVTRVLGLEIPDLASRVVDVEARSEPSEQLVAELHIDTAHTHIALRAGQRWIPDVLPIPGESSEAANDATRINGLRRDGHYLIVGGTGGVGLSLANYLSSEYGAKLSLTSRSGYPTADSDSSPEARRRVDAIDSLSEAANGLAVFAADISSIESMQTVVKQAEARFGPIDGVISAAGVADQGGVIQRRTAEQMRDSISSKVHGSLVLAEVFDGYGLDFLVLSSSVAATLWHNRFAQVGYVVANSFVEALPLAKPHLPIVTIAWDDWTEIGMSVRAAEEFTSNYGEGVELVDELNSFTPAEGVRVFEKSLVAGQSVLVVSPTDLRDRIRDDVHQVSPFLSTAFDQDDSIEADSGRDAKDVIRSAWADLLGYTEIDMSDDFFELGGDSLQSARLADKLSRALGTEIPLPLIFGNSTLAAMTSAVEELVIGSEGGGASEPNEEPTNAALSPAQLRFAARGNTNPDHFNISSLLRPSISIDSDRLHTVVRALVLQHPALRTVVDFDSGEQRVLDIDDWDGFVTRTIPTEEELESLCTKQHEELSLQSGQVFTATLIDIEDTGEQRVFLIMHHCVSDRVSLLLLIDALSDSYQSTAPAPVSNRTLPSFGRWVGELAEAARGESGQSAETQLLALPWNDAPLLCKSEETPNRNRDGATVRVEIPAERTERLLAIDDTELDEIVLVGLLGGLSSWTAGDASAVEVLNHGRRLLDLDVSRSVGFFLSYMPVLLSKDQAADPESALPEIRRQKEFSWLFDAVRFYGDDTGDAGLGAIRRPEVLLNYVGRPIAATGQGVFVPTEESRGRETAADGNRDHPIALMVELSPSNEMTLTFVYSTKLHTWDEIANLADLVSARLTEIAEALAHQA